MVMKKSLKLLDSVSDNSIFQLYKVLLFSALPMAIPLLSVNGSMATLEHMLTYLVTILL